MTKRPELGQQLFVTGKAFRKKEYDYIPSTQERHWRYSRVKWEPVALKKPAYGVFMGYRFVQNGSLEVYYDEPAYFRQNGAVEVWIIVTNPRQNPLYAFPNQCAFLEDGDMEAVDTMLYASEELVLPNRK